MMQRSSALIAAKPGWLQDGLQAIVRAVPQIEGVDRADDGPSALRMIAEHPPALILLDVDLSGDGIQAVLRQIKTGWPQIQCIVLVNNSQQGQIISADGADAVLVKGFSVTALTETVAKLLSRIERMTGGH